MNKPTYELPSSPYLTVTGTPSVHSTPYTHPVGIVLLVRDLGGGVVTCGSVVLVLG